MGVVMAGMYADLFFITRLVQVTVFLDVIVVADTFPVETGVVTVPEHIDGEALVAACRAAMNNNQVDLTRHNVTVD